jgi:hypothetical protein
MSLTSYAEEIRLNPLDVVERLASHNDWSFERPSDDEITILVTGRWTDYQLSYTWMDDIEALHLACAFDLKVPERRSAEVKALKRRASSASRCCRPRSTPASATSRHFNSSSGRARQRRKRSTRRCSRPRARLDPFCRHRACPGDPA